MNANTVESPFQHSSTPSAQAPEPFITSREVARRLKKSERTIQRWIHRNWLPYYKLGRSVRFKWTEVQAKLHQSFHVPRNDSQS